MSQPAMGLRLQEVVRSGSLYAAMDGPETPQRQDTARLQEVDAARPEGERLTAENARLTDELAQALRLNELFAGILSHDLRNPLGAILMSATVLSRKVEDENLKRAIGRILTAGNRMSDMITELLDFTRARAPGGLRLECVRTNVAVVFGRAIEERHDLAGGRAVSFERHGDSWGSWDPNRLAQVASNLVGNAVRHGTPDGAIDVRIDGADSNSVIIDVTNAGAIPPDLLPVIFEPFQSAELPSRKGGLGLGLYLTHAIVAGHQGTVEVASADGSTTFTVRLPRGS